MENERLNCVDGHAHISLLIRWTQNFTSVMWKLNMLTVLILWTAGPCGRAV
jgi:hypothetical protein